MNNSIIDKILTEWAYRVHDGMPDIKNPLHIFELKQSMEKLNLPKEFVFEFIQNLFEEKTFYARAKKSGKIVIFKNKDEWKQKIKSGSHKPVDSDEAEKEMGKKEKEPEGEPGAEKKPEGEPEGAPPSKPKIVKIDKHQFKGDDAEKEDKAIPDDEEEDDVVV